MTLSARVLAVLLALVLATSACSGDDDDTATDTSEEAAEGSSTTAATAEEPGEDDATEEPEEAMAEVGPVTITAVSFEDSTVTIRNDGTEAIDFAGWRICNRPSYAAMPEETLEPGATLDVDASAVDIRASGGEFGLYTSSSFDNPDDMVAYVQWGGPDNGRASVAVAAGLIAEGDFVDNGGEDFTTE